MNPNIRVSVGLILASLLPLLVRAADSFPASLSLPGATAVVSLNGVVVPSIQGLGIQWDPYAYPPAPREWELTTNRLDYARPAFFRVMFRAGLYCCGFDSSNPAQPRYVYTENPEAQGQFASLLRILDYAQSRNIDVLLGEWSPPGRLGRGINDDVSRPDDPRWARMITDFVSWLRNKRGYTVIRMYNMMNEPNGDWMWPDKEVDYKAWKNGIHNLRREFDTHGLVNLPIVGPDNSGNWDWIDRASREMPECFGAWEMHWYARDQEILTNKIEQILSQKRNVLLANDPQAARKHLFLAESGLADGKCNGDQQPRVRTFLYGVLISDYVAQVFRAGWGGACAWDLDDAMHTVGDQQPTRIPDDHLLKVWGFWNTQGPAMGHPEEENIRPWFYSWSLMSRLFPRDTRLLAVRQSDQPHLKVVAGTLPSGGVSIMVVNDADEARIVTVSILGAGQRTVWKYDYFEDDRPSDMEGFPVPKAVISGANLDVGLKISLPSRGVVFLATE